MGILETRGLDAIYVKYSGMTVDMTLLLIGMLNVPERKIGRQFILTHSDTLTL